MSVSFQTNKTGAAATVCSTSTIKYNFSVAQSTTAANATFAMSKGSSTTASCTVAIYNQPNGGGSVVASVTLPATAFVSSSYPDVVFTFPAGTNLTANTDYSLVITSSTGCNGANAYSMKPGSFQVIDTTTLTVLNTGYAIAAAPSGYVTATAVARGNFALTSANVGAAALSANLALNKNYLIAAVNNVSSQLAAGATVDMACGASIETRTSLAPAPNCAYDTAASATARAVLFASTEPYLFVESNIGCEAASSAVALQIAGAQASVSGATTLTADLTLQTGDYVRFYFGTSAVHNLYIGAIKISKAYIGSTLLLDVPT